MYVFISGQLLLLAGDNMLTAVSVARDCGMVGPTHKVCLSPHLQPSFLV